MLRHYLTSKLNKFCVVFLGMSHELVYSLLGLPGPHNNDFKKSVNSWFYSLICS